MPMFWAGAMMVFAPLVFFGILIGIWWYRRKQARKFADTSSSLSSPVPVQPVQE